MNKAQKARIKWLLTINIGKRKRIVRIFGIYILNSNKQSAINKALNTIKQKLRRSYYKHYLTSLELSKRNNHKTISAKIDGPFSETSLIAFYLPQYHPIPENDQAWGRGFTEWANTTTSVAQFVGHYQPRIPGELGYYDLRIKDIQLRQIELAKHHGLSGFCYYYYWFDGKPILDTPINNVLDNKDLDFPFCLCWANENWTKAWDGADKEVIIRQNHSADDDAAFIKHISPALQDERYIRINGNPLLIVYKPDLLPDPESTAKLWRKIARESGIGEIHLGMAYTLETSDPASIGFDSLIQFPPHRLPVGQKNVTLLNQDYSGKVYDYDETKQCALDQLEIHQHMIPGVMMGWDNSARRPGKGNVYHGCTPESYQDWLERALRHTNANKDSQRMIFINAWNEWAEGTYLEPDRRYGYDYLEATSNAIQRSGHLH